MKVEVRARGCVGVSEELVRGVRAEEEEESKVAAHSFMSEAGCFYLGSVGLLGEYCPTTRKRHKELLRGSGRPSVLHAAQLTSASATASASVS